MSTKSVQRYIEIVEAGTSPSGLTKRWYVVNKFHNEDVGIIRWHGAWRKYVFEQEGNIFYDCDCLRFIADFIETATKDHKR